MLLRITALAASRRRPAAVAGAPSRRARRRLHNGVPGPHKGAHPRPQWLKRVITCAGHDGDNGRRLLHGRPVAGAPHAPSLDTADIPVLKRSCTWLQTRFFGGSGRACRSTGSVARHRHTPSRRLDRAEVLLQPLLRRDDGRPPRRDGERRRARASIFHAPGKWRDGGRLRRVARLLADADRVPSSPSHAARCSHFSASAASPSAWEIASAKARHPRMI